MAKQNIIIGAPNAGGGDTYYTAANKTVENFNELYDAKNIKGPAKFDSPAGNFGESPGTPKISAAIELDKTDAVSAGTCGIYFKGAVLTVDNFTGGHIVVFSGSNILDELCLIWIVYDKINNCFMVNIQVGATGYLPPTGEDETPPAKMIINSIINTIDEVPPAKMVILSVVLSDVVAPAKMIINSVLVAAITIVTTSAAVDFTFDEIINTGDNIIWDVEGGQVQDLAGNLIPVFDLTANVDTMIITGRSSTKYAGLDKIKIRGLNVIDVNISAATELTVLTANDNALINFDVDKRPTLNWLYLQDNLLDGETLDKIVNDIDKYGLSNGNLYLARNAGSLSSAAYAGYNNLIAKGWNIDVSQPSNPEPPTIGDTPALFNFRIETAQPYRIYFDSTKIITGTTVNGFKIEGKTFDNTTPVTIAAGFTTGHYFTLSTPLNFWDNILIRYEGVNDSDQSNISDLSSVKLYDFTLRYIRNNTVEPSVNGVIYYVATHGNDSSVDPEDIITPWRTITKAAATAVAGDTVYVKAGAYSLNENIALVNSGAVDNPIRFIGYKDSINDAALLDRSVLQANGSAFSSSNLPLISGSNNVFNGASQDNLIIKNLQIKNDSSAESTGTLNLNNCNNVYVYNVYTDGGLHGIWQYGSTSYGNRVNRCYASNVTASGIRQRNKHHLIYDSWSLTTKNTGHDYYLSMMPGVDGHSMGIINSYAYRYPGDSHTGHGLSVRGGAAGTNEYTQFCLVENNTTVNMKNSGVEFRRTGSRYNISRGNLFTRDDFTEYIRGIKFAHGCHDNSVENCVIDGVQGSDVSMYGVYYTSWWEEDPSVHYGGLRCTVKNTLFKNVKYVLVTGITQSQGSNDIPEDNIDNSLLNCTIVDSAVLVYDAIGTYGSTNKIGNSLLNSVLSKGADNGYKMEYSNFYSGFTKPNEIGNIAVDPNFIPGTYTPQEIALKNGLAVIGVEYDTDGVERSKIDLVDEKQTIGYKEI